MCVDTRATAQQFSNFSCMQSSFENVLASNQRAVVEEATYIPLICYESFLLTNKQPTIFGSVVGMSSRLVCSARTAPKGAPMDVIS